MSSSDGVSLLSQLNLSRNNYDKVVLGFSLYQYLGLSKCDPMTEALNSVVSYKYGEMVQEPMEVVDNLNELAEIYINGKKVKITELHQFRGNGHIDYYFVLDADFCNNFVDSVAMRCGVIPDASLESYYGLIPGETDGNLPIYRKALNSLYDLWNFKIGYEAETNICSIIYGSQSGTPHGTIHSLWLVYKEDGNAVSLLGTSTDLMNIWGIHPALYDISLSSDKKTLYFSCNKDNVEYSFSVDLATAAVKQIK